MCAAVTAIDIDALLPQTQCGLCGYKGCMPYANAIEQKKAPINLCPPGGVAGLIALGNLLDIDPAPYIPDMKKNAKPTLRAVIREAECIGCTKCISACPVDAIVGAAKQMHSIITVDCTGCELCIAPCPVDCIDLFVIPNEESADLKKEQSEVYRKRYLAREARLALEKNEKKQTPDLLSKQNYIQAALLRMQNLKK